jgi:Calcineurin-like phosphoesterase
MQELGPGNIWAVRYVNGSLGEVLYPPANDLLGHNNSYWAYDANAQNNASADRPPGLPPNPFPGWQPGQTTYNRQPFSVAQVQQWYEWYVDARMDFVNWHTKLFRDLGFTGYLQLQTPGFGARPSEYATATANFLNGTGDPNQTMGRAAIWQKVYAKLTDRSGVTAYVSSMADGSGNPQDQGCQSIDTQVDLEHDPQVNNWSGVRYVSHLADTYGMTKSGENPGSSDPNRKVVYGRTMLASAAAQMAACSFQSMFWAQDQNLYDGVSGVKLADFTALAATPTLLPTPTPQPTVHPLVIAVIGDYGCLPGSDCTTVSYSAPHEQAVADLVHSWSPDAIVTVGDNSYETGTPAAVQADQRPYKADVTAGKLYATMGNHDWLTGSDTASTSYFGRPSHYVAHLGGGLVDLFVADTHYQDPDGASVNSNQAKQFYSDLASSKAIWKITANHESQYSSGNAGSYAAFRWLSASGIDLALSGHDHDFEHLVVGGQNYVVAGGGGQSLAPVCTKGCIQGSVWHDSSHFGAVRLTITASRLTCEFVTSDGILENSFELSKPPQ